MKPRTVEAFSKHYAGTRGTIELHRDGRRVGSMIVDALDLTAAEAVDLFRAAVIQDAAPAVALPLLAVLREVLGFADTSDVAHLWKEKGEQAAYQSVMNRARKAARS